MCHGQILDQAMRAARKQHRCDFCHKPVRVGEEHHVQKIARDGEISTWRTHRVCEAILQASDPYDYEGCMIGEPIEHAREVAKLVGWSKLLGLARSMLMKRTKR